MTPAAKRILDGLSPELGPHSAAQAVRVARGQVVIEIFWRRALLRDVAEIPVSVEKNFRTTTATPPHAVLWGNCGGTVEERS